MPFSKDIPGLYIHIPFCVQRCHYCDFYSIRTSLFDKESDAYQLFIDSLHREIELYRHELQNNRFSSLYIGGGTPSILPPKLFSSLCDRLFQSFSFTDDLEFTVEANPESIDKDKLFSYKNWGVNRVSFGAQTFNNSILKAIGRLTTADEVITKFHLLRDTGFDNINLDLISGLVNQSYEDYTSDLDKATELAPDHLSCYSLIQGKAILQSRIENGSLILPQEETARQELILTHKHLTNHNYDHYEVSNYARPGKSCRHNLVYWTQKDYLGLGPSASGALFGTRYTNTASLKHYATLLRDNKKPISSTENLDPIKRRTELIMLSLRTKRGLDLSALKNLSQAIDPTDSSWYNSFQNKAGDYIRLGLLTESRDHLSATLDGLLILDSVISGLI